MYSRLPLTKIDMKLSTQEQKVYDYIRKNRGATSHDITRDTFVQKPCARLADMRAKGVKITSIGQKKYPGSRAFEMYAIDEAPTRMVSRFAYDEQRGCMVEQRFEVTL